MNAGRWVAGLTLAVVVVWGGAAGAMRSSAKPARVDKATPVLQPDGPLRGVVMTGPLPEAGPPTDWRLAFTTDDRKATAVVGLSSDARKGAKLRVAWYRVGGPGKRTHLFTHKLKVRAGGGLALSRGVAKQGLAPGTYEVVATMGKRQVRVPWVVRIADEPGGAAGRKGLSVTGAEGSTLEDWEIPTPGEQGWYEPEAPAEPSEPSGPRPCTVDSINGSMSPMTDVRASAWFLGECSTRTLTAAVSGPPVTLDSSTEPGGPLSSLHGAVDICTDLAGGSDLPGTVVHYAAAGSDGAAITSDYTLPDLGEIGPVVGIETVPPAGTRVKAGDTIKVRALAMLMPPALGVKVLYLSAGDELLESVPNLSGSSEPVPCDLGRYYALIQSYRYEVPDDPPPVITLTADSADFQGRRGDYSTETVQFPTVDRAWTGTIRATSSGTDCEGEERGTVVLGVDEKRVSGQIDASGSYTCDPGITVPTAGTIRLEGTFEDGKLRLNVARLTGMLLASPSCQTGQRLEIPVRDGAGSADLSYTASSGDVYSCTITVQRARE